MSTMAAKKKGDAARIGSVSAKQTTVGTVQAAAIETPCIATGWRGSIHNALLMGKYETYARAAPKAMGPGARKTFGHAVTIFSQVESALLAGGHLRKWQREMLEKMYEVAIGADDRDHALARLREFCGPFLERAKQTAPLPEHFTYATNIFSIAHPDLARLTPHQIFECVTAELKKGRKKMGAASLAAALWNTAGLGSRGAKRLTNAAVNTAAKRAIDRSKGKNDPA